MQWWHPPSLISKRLFPLPPPPRLPTSSPQNRRHCTSPWLGEQRRGRAEIGEGENSTHFPTPPSAGFTNSKAKKEAKKSVVVPETQSKSSTFELCRIPDLISVAASLPSHYYNVLRRRRGGKGGQEKKGRARRKRRKRTFFLPSFLSFFSSLARFKTAEGGGEGSVAARRRGGALGGAKGGAGGGGGGRGKTGEGERTHSPLCSPYTATAIHVRVCL